MDEYDFSKFSGKLCGVNVSIICGAELNEDKLHRLPQRCGISEQEWAAIAVDSIIFPERRGGNAVVREKFNKSLLSSLNEDRHIVVITCYATLLNFVGAMCEAGVLEYSKCWVYLVDEINHITAHGYDRKGCLTDDWPFGVLD